MFELMPMMVAMWWMIYILIMMKKSVNFNCFTKKIVLFQFPFFEKQKGNHVRVKEQLDPLLFWRFFRKTGGLLPYLLTLFPPPRTQNLETRLRKFWNFEIFFAFSRFLKGHGNNSDSALKLPHSNSNDQTRLRNFFLSSRGGGK